MVYIGMDGCALALDAATGAEIWRTKLRGDFVNIVLQDGNLYATTSGEIYCLDPSTGQIRWHNPLKGLGLGLVTIATSGDQQIPVLRQKQQDEEAATGAGSATAI